ncbi:MAG: hypothetical protein G8345_06365 [Magnetococcales bacterium]|nr:Spy/CpxP family protein refolding chaperone [Magnetococcales bacterium]NGZ26494.1 hypothetical protein [Magnetococcales bacterium]
MRVHSVKKVMMAMAVLFCSGLAFAEEPPAAMNHSGHDMGNMANPVPMPQPWPGNAPGGYGGGMPAPMGYGAPPYGGMQGGYPQGHMRDPASMGGMMPQRGQGGHQCQCQHMKKGEGGMAGQNAAPPAPGMEGGNQQMPPMMGQPPMMGGQPPMMGGQSPMMGKPPQMGENMAEMHMENMKRQIGITEGQNADWQAYTSALKEQMAVHAEKRQQKAAMATMNSLELAEARLKIMEKALEKRKATVSAYQKLYNSLNDEQKARANMAFAGLPVMGGL